MSRYAIVAATFYRELADALITSAHAALTEAGSEDIDLFEVPGAFELPLAARYCALSTRYAGVVCVGAVIRGETTHYDYVCTEAARGIMDVQLATGIPCGFGVLTVEDMEQARARAGGGKRDSGRHAADAVLALVTLRAQLGGQWTG